ncbi:septal ring lytic transglycosylase RlpA family protein [Pelagibacterium montanilacus]|uniref:septal ring lytic transglycosylase RlpA family protein n=1 Tax=Pelagibacterium montanilacus TaxID=2185280 RepID=UPI000F8DA18E|nr:septal ring lytic transglycosylase RlpA family protein [Pelagibacterium montanilacus]
MKFIKSAALAVVILTGSTPLAISTTAAQETAVVQTLSGVASWYGGKFHGRTTANGETYNMHAMTAAHKTLPFGTQVVVTNQNNGRSVVVRINDRGPYAGGRIIDLSREAANQIGMINAGTASVKVEVLGGA